MMSNKLCVQDRENVYVMFIDLMDNFDIRPEGNK